MEVIKNSIREFKGLCKYVNRNFGDIILLDRRIAVRDYEGEVKQEAAG